MCCFAGPVRHVGATRIFARVQGRSQALVYAMSVDSEGPNAMILPLPVAAGTGDGGVEFVDLSGYPEFFDDLDKGFPATLSLDEGSLSFSGMATGGAVLAVEKVGSFEASFVPRIRDFERLDPRFRLSPAVLNDLRHYGDSGFAVFQLAPGPQTVHPMALRFPTRDPGTLFFPTVHVHDGTVQPAATFDHTLYAQADAPGGWDASEGPASGFMDVGRSAGLVDPALGVRRLALRGRRENADTVLPGDAPALVYAVAEPPEHAARNPSAIDLFNYLVWLMLTKKASEVRLAGSADGLAIEVETPGGTERPTGPRLTTLASALYDVRRHMDAAGQDRWTAKVVRGKTLTSVECTAAGPTLTLRPL
ncbi:MAG: hypothetical protein FD126_1239 [Elusimicrobia bacterium]|nr:MAG: hypothetical protein FD126_1239 [Elusimicrobiota bacterium]